MIAIGNPFGLGGTVTAGIVSADGRMIGAGRYDDFLQIDAPINRGNSGGPTFNLEGKVVGINTAIQSPTGGNVGIGFAIPANQAKRIIEDLHEDGTVDRGWLGVHIQGLDEDLAKSLGLDDAEGALVAQVTPDSPAASAGFRQGDVILSYSGKQIKNLRDLTSAVADTAAGTEADVVVWRDGSEKTIAVEIGQMPEQDQMAALSGDEQPQESDAPKLGLMLSQLTPEAREQFELPDDAEGVLVTDVQPGSPAAEKGLQRGDVIVQADRNRSAIPRRSRCRARGSGPRRRTIRRCPARGSERFRRAWVWSAPTQELVATFAATLTNGAGGLVVGPCRFLCHEPYGTRPVDRQWHCSDVEVLAEASYARGQRCVSPTRFGES